MRRINITKDVESRRNIATATPIAGVLVPETVVINKTDESYAKSEEVQGGEGNSPAQTEPGSPAKRGRKTAGNV